MNAETLYPLVTESIRRAEMLAELGAPGAAAAHMDVSFIEEKIADSLPPTDEEGAIARRGAVWAALSARDFTRARKLADRFAAEPAISPALKTELAALIDEAGQAVAARDQSRFPRAAKRYGLPELHRVIQAWLRQGEPFPIG